MKTLYIMKTENGFELVDSDGDWQGVVETLSEAIKSAEAFVEMGLMGNYIVEE